MAGGLVAAADEAKASSKPDKSEEASDADLSSFDEYASDAFDAVQDSDMAAFKKALKGAIKACYESEEE